MRHYWLYIFLIFLVVLGVLSEPASSEWFRFDRQRIQAGEWWRLLSAHFVHLSHLHALGNALGVAMCAYIAGPYLNNLKGVLLLLWCACWVGLGLFYWADYLHRYVGLSGVLHGLLVVAPFVSGYYSRKIAWLFAFLIGCKVLWEQSPWYDDMAAFSFIGGRVEVNAHLLGFLAGVFFLVILRINRAMQKEKKDEQSVADS